MERTNNLLALFLMLWIPLGSIWALDIPPAPKQLVSDNANILSVSEVQKLEQKLVAYDNKTSTQIAVVTISSLKGDDLFDFSQRLAEKWGIGGGNNDNGVLLLIAVKDRKIRIHTGYGVEGAIPDAISKRIIENDIKPAFQRNDYFAGIDKATNSMMAALAGEYVASEKADKKGIPWGVIPIIIIFIIYMIVGTKRRFTGYGHSGRRYYGGSMIGGGLGRGG
ncbi:MAG: TPM domain-containing protein, partial [Salibacteraceae bacterium]